MIGGVTDAVRGMDGAIDGARNGCGCAGTTRGAIGGTAGAATFGAIDTPLRLPMRWMRRSRSSLPCTLAPGPNVGVLTASSAPAPSASYTRPALPLTVAVTTRIGQGATRMIWRVASTPFTRGMMRSIRIRSGFERWACTTASSPSRAIHATESAGSAAIARRSASHATARSFTIAIFTTRLCARSP